jgi:hypothetical protein
MKWLDGLLVLNFKECGRKDALPKLLGVTSKTMKNSSQLASCPRLEPRNTKQECYLPDYTVCCTKG